MPHEKKSWNVFIENTWIFNFIWFYIQHFLSICLWNRFTSLILFESSIYNILSCGVWLLFLDTVPTTRLFFVMQHVTIIICPFSQILLEALPTPWKNLDKKANFLARYRQTWLTIWKWSHTNQGARKDVSTHVAPNNMKNNCR